MPPTKQKRTSATLKSFIAILKENGLLSTQENHFVISDDFEEKMSAIFNWYDPETRQAITEAIHFNEKEFTESKEDEKGAIIFLRACDMHAVKRIDAIYLQNKFEDFYYKRVRDKVKFVVVGCHKSFDSCFCVSMGSNRYDDYHMGVNFRENELLLDIKDSLFEMFKGEEKEFQMDFVIENEVEI